jgi:Domain of unknown function (DUF4387)/Acyclic terpene utilisation family protein AtuA
MTRPICFRVVGGSIDENRQSMKSSVMPKLVYRVVAACGTLGYGYPRESLQSALNGQVDAIVCDGGSMDAGPYFLGTGTAFFDREAIKADYRDMVAAGKKIGCPVILGSSGMAGGNRNVDWMLDLAKEVFAELNVTEARVAVIRSELDPEIVVNEYRVGALSAIGTGPKLDEETLRESTIVGQMGVHPLITALNGGAQFIIAGRSCDVALFASDMIRRGISAGLAYHVGQVLECGALACDPGSPSDCLVAEVYDDGSAVFSSPNPARRCTPYSLAAHSLHQEIHPQLQFYPEGILATEKTQFFARDGRTAGFRGSALVRDNNPTKFSIKVEGARWLGPQKTSLIYIDPAQLSSIPKDILVYGRNGVRPTPVGSSSRELGIVIETSAKKPKDAARLARLLARYMFHFGYPGRKTTAGNIAFPMSPSLISFRREDGQFGSIVPSGTRDPVFLANYTRIKSAIFKSVSEEFPDALANASFTITDADAQNPAVFLRTFDRDREKLEQRHRQEIDRVTSLAVPKSSSRMNMEAPDAYAWSLYHLLQSKEVIEAMFPITYYTARGAIWEEDGVDHAQYFEIADRNHGGDVDFRTLSLIDDHTPAETPIGEYRLLDMATIIRSKDVGINRQTFDIFFTSAENYEAALQSNLFSRESIAKILDLPLARIIGTFFVDACNAIKISVERPNIFGSVDERDIFGTQQQSVLEELNIPFYPVALTRASPF